MGVKEFNLLFLSEHSQGIVDLPSVVFEAKSLSLLHLYKCNLGQHTPENIPFVRLKVLRLCLVSVEKETFDKIISSCPLLTNMWFQECEGLKTIKLDKTLHKYLKHFTFINRRTHITDECSIDIDIPTLETINIIGTKIRFQGHKFGNLKSFSLQSDSIEQSQMCIDAPNIEYFWYSGYFIPSISLTPTLRRSTVKLYIRDVHDAQSWFLRLSKLLHALSRSEIYLNIVHIQEDILVQDIINGGNRPAVVESLNLDIGHLPSFPSVLNGLFCICRPRSINPHWFSQGRWNTQRKLEELGELFGRIQMMRESGNQEIWKDLEDLTIESFDESRREWQPIQVARLSVSPLPNITSLRIGLKWSEASECSSKLLES